LRQLGLFAASLLGAAILAAGIAALTVPNATLTAPNFFTALFAKLPGIFRLDFGVSAIAGMPALAALAPALALTGQLLLASAILTLVAGLPAGLLLADERLRGAAAPLLQAAGAIPIFCVAMVFAVAQGHSPGGPVTPGSLFALFSTDKNAQAFAFNHFAAPVLIVGLSGASVLALSLWRALGVAQAQPYREGLRRMGMSERDIFTGFAVRHALALTLKDAGNVLLALFAGIAVVEWVFGWPGAGAQFVHAVALEDWPEASAIVFLIAGLRIAADLAGGLAAGALLGWDNAA
jgi:peptide/nickel transport system permease protein